MWFMLRDITNMLVWYSLSKRVFAVKTRAGPMNSGDASALIYAGKPCHHCFNPGPISKWWPGAGSVLRKTITPNQSWWCPSLVKAVAQIISNFEREGTCQFRTENIGDFCSNLSALMPRTAAIYQRGAMVYQPMYIFFDCAHTRNAP